MYLCIGFHLHLQMSWILNDAHMVDTALSTAVVRSSSMFSVKLRSTKDSTSSFIGTSMRPFNVYLVWFPFQFPLHWFWRNVICVKSSALAKVISHYTPSFTFVIFILSFPIRHTEPPSSMQLSCLQRHGIARHGFRTSSSWSQGISHPHGHSLRMISSFSDMLLR